MQNRVVRNPAIIRLDPPLDDPPLDASPVDADHSRRPLSLHRHPANVRPLILSGFRLRGFRLREFRLREFRLREFRPLLADRTNRSHRIFDRCPQPTLDRIQLVVISDLLILEVRHVEDIDHLIQVGTDLGHVNR